MASVTISDNTPRIIRANHNGSYTYLTQLDVVHNGTRVTVWHLMPLSFSSFKRTYGTGGSYIKFSNIFRDSMGYRSGNIPYGVYSCDAYADFRFVQNQIIQSSSSLFRGIVLTDASPVTDSDIGDYGLSSFDIGTFNLGLRIYPNTSASGNFYTIAVAQMVKPSGSDYIGFADWAAFRDANLSGMSQWSLTPNSTGITVQKSGSASVTILKQ